MEYEVEGVGNVKGAGSGPLKLDDQVGERPHRLSWETAEGEKFRLTVVAPEEQLDLDRDGRVDAAEIRASVNDLVVIEGPRGKIFSGRNRLKSVKPR